MIICVVATASALRGALAIYKQFLASLEIYGGEDEWHLFVDNNMPMPNLSNVVYHIRHTKGWGRVWFDLFGFKKDLKRIGIKPDVVVSLQNTGLRCRAERNVIYYHQSLPLYKYQFHLSDRAAKENLFYYYAYPQYVKFFMNSRTYVAVQTDTLRGLFVERYHFPIEKVGVYFPNVDIIDLNSFASYSYEHDSYHFMFPSTSAPYKEHISLVLAMKSIWTLRPDVAPKIRIHFTVKESDMSDIVKRINDGGMHENFVFNGNLPRHQVLSMMKASHGLLFPSMIESIGLPLLEAASMGIPVIANDLAYVHETLGNYDGVQYVRVHDYEGWAKAILSICDSHVKFPPYSVPENHSWERFFKLIKEGTVL